MNNWQKATLVKSALITPDIRSFLFKVEKPKKHLAGQYYDIRPLNKPTIRSFTISSSPKDINILEFTIKLFPKGDLSPLLFNLKKGEQVEINGPKGEFILRKKEQHPLLYIAAGTGIIPFISMVRDTPQLSAKRNIVLLLSTKSSQDILFKKELKTLEKSNLNFKFLITLTNDKLKSKTNFRGRINHTILKETLNLLPFKDLKIYLCGSTSFVDNTWLMLIKLGINPNQMYRERFGPYIY